MKKKYFTIGGLIVTVFITWLALGSESEEPTTLFVTPSEGPFEVEVTTTGELRAKNSTYIRGPRGILDFRIYNVAIQRLVPEGTVVEKGDLVAELDRSEMADEFQDAQLQLEERQSEYEIAKLDTSLTLSQARNNLINMEYTLEERQLAVEQAQYESPATRRQTEIDYDRAVRELEQEKKSYTTQLSQAQARLREIEANLRQEKRDLERIQQMLEEFTIHAPENGMVIYRRQRNGSKITEGDNISTWDPVVAELPDFSVMESVTYINEVDIQQVKRGQSVVIGLDAIPDKTLSGLVTSVANIGEQRPNGNSKVFEVVIEVNESDTTLRPAMTTSNSIHIDSLDDAIFVPLETIHSQDSLDFVFKQEGLETVMQQVELGMMNDDEIVVNGGLSPDDRLYLTIPEDTTGVQKILLNEESITSN